ncbi:MAG: hypothetical protein LBH73_04455 [Spirochaetaceae bacterium]|jgi:hypothetical protein|nr:hypothetical protein [Spirochaetaceae bacterium]
MNYQSGGSLSLKAMSTTEREDVIKTMSDNFDAQEDPRVGIFWYDPEDDELFGVTSSAASELSFNDRGRKTVKLLHKTWWKKQQERAKARGQLTSKFMKDYTQTPRGRIFQTEGGLFEVMCGSWINERIIELVKDEFNLHGVQLEVKVDEHWEIGHGWSDEYF